MRSQYVTMIDLFYNRIKLTFKALYLAFSDTKKSVMYSNLENEVMDLMTGSFCRNHAGTPK